MLNYMLRLSVSRRRRRRRRRAAGSHEYSFKVGQTVCTLRGHVLGTVAAWDTDTSMFVVNVAVDRTQQFVPGRRARVRLWSRARGGLCVGWDGGWL